MKSVCARTANERGNIRIKVIREKVRGDDRGMAMES